MHAYACSCTHTYTHMHTSTNVQRQNRRTSTACTPTKCAPLILHLKSIRSVASRSALSASWLIHPNTALIDINSFFPDSCMCMCMCVLDVFCTCYDMTWKLVCGQSNKARACHDAFKMRHLETPKSNENMYLGSSFLSTHLVTPGIKSFHLS